VLYALIINIIKGFFPFREIGQKREKTMKRYYCYGNDGIVYEIVAKSKKEVRKILKEKGLNLRID
jgi:hypothetical protein